LAERYGSLGILVDSKNNGGYIFVLVAIISILLAIEPTNISHIVWYYWLMVL
jgi:hypothetical protein